MMEGMKTVSHSSLVLNDAEKELGSLQTRLPFGTQSLIIFSGRREYMPLLVSWLRAQSLPVSR